MAEESIHSSGILNAAAPTVTAAMADELRGVVARGQKRWRRLILFEAVGLGISAPLAYLWLVFLFDNVVHLSTLGRLAANLAFVVGLWKLASSLVRRWRLSTFTEDQVALAIEGRTSGGLQNRLINAIQLSRNANEADPSMRLAVVEENCRCLKQAHLEQSKAVGPAVSRMTAAFALILAGAIYWAWGGERFTRAATRILLPFANVSPVYRTVLTVEPGDVTLPAGNDVVITIRIGGHVPRELMLLTSRGAEQASLRIPIAPGKRTVSYTLESVARSMTYAVRGGDFTTPYYQITVPTPLELKRVTTVYRFPDYTGLPERRQESASGDLEALAGTRAGVTFSFNQPVDEARMLVRRTASAGSDFPSASNRTAAAEERIPLRRVGAQDYATDLLFKDSISYRLESSRRGKEPIRSVEYALRAVPDQTPELSLTGIKQQAEVMMESVLPLGATAKDDYGLVEVGVFYRPLSTNGTTQAPDDKWKPVQVWPMEKKALTFQRDLPLSVAMLDVVDGESMELALRARDNDPAKGRLWTTGPLFRVVVTSPGAELQIQYERILQTERDLDSVIRQHEQLADRATEWIAKLDPQSGLRWDDAKNLDALAAAVQEQAGIQSQLRRQSAEIARAMVEQAGETPRISVGMLADTEMVRGIRILESVPKRETPQAQRSALSDAKLTEQRIVRSLREVLENYVQFRREWEMAHMLGFTEMLATRQSRMEEVSATYAQVATNIVGEAQRNSVSRRQVKLLDLSGLAQTAFRGMAEQREAVGATMADAFLAAAGAFDSTGLKPAMQAASQSLAAGQWREAMPRQHQAAEGLQGICRDVRKAKLLAAQQAIAALKELAKSNAEAQKALDKLQAGTDENLYKMEEGLSLVDIIHMQKLADDLKKKKHPLPEEEGIEDYLLDDAMRTWLARPQPAQVDVNTLKLGDAPSAVKSFPSQSDREANAAQTVIQEKFEDLVGDLLDEAEELRDDYETYNMNTSWGCADAGTVGKMAGDINGSGSTSTTGNMKPPTANVGGASRAGRLGARSHGLVVGDEIINRRGRDQAQEGQEELADQPGQLKEKMSEDPQKDPSTGTGGKVVDAKETSFSTKDAGEWKDKDADRLRAPQAKNQIVERKGKPLDPKVAESMRDMESQQEQVIERIKSIKKELDQLYLPTDHLDEIMRKLQANLDRLKDKPDRDIFRQQIELIDKLKGTVVVFNRPSSEFEQSLQRAQAVKGRILDEAAVPAMPGYEEAVTLYYRKLSGL